MIINIIKTHDINNVLDFEVKRLISSTRFMIIIENSINVFFQSHPLVREKQSYKQKCLNK